MDTATWLSVVSIVIAGGLAALRVWEPFFLRPKIVMSFDWTDSPLGQGSPTMSDVSSLRLP